MLHESFKFKGRQNHSRVTEVRTVITLGGTGYWGIRGRRALPVGVRILPMMTWVVVTPGWTYEEVAELHT